MNESLTYRIIDILVEHVGIWLTGEELQELADRLLEAFEDWFHEDLRS